MVDFESIGHNMTNLQIQLANVFFTHDRYKYTNETGEPGQNYPGKIFHVLKFRKSTGPQLHCQDRNIDFGSQRYPLYSAEGLVGTCGPGHLRVGLVHSLALIKRNLS